LTLWPRHIDREDLPVLALKHWAPFPQLFGKHESIEAVEFCQTFLVVKKMLYCLNYLRGQECQLPNIRTVSRQAGSRGVEEKSREPAKEIMSSAWEPSGVRLIS